MRLKINTPRPLVPLGLMSLVLAIAGCAPASRPLTHDAYVWQRQWGTGVTSALAHSRDLVRDWRILAAQTDAHGRLRTFSVNRAALAATDRPVILVVRIDGQLAQWDADALIAEIVALRDGWGGSSLAGIEIDHDCGTARLPAYAHFLSRLKQRLGQLPLSITALPAWLSSSDLDTLLAIADEAVLQVHAVQSPQAGLFDRELARRWIDSFSARTRKPFRVALPTYATRVSWDERGQVISVESEVPTLTGGAQASELVAHPDDVAQLLVSLDHNRPSRLAGVVWFRLPTATDDRAWSLSTWRAVVTGEPLKSELVALTQPGQADGILDILLRNEGAGDAPLPSRVTLPPGCRLADGINGYGFAREGDRLVLKRTQAGWLHAHRKRAIGWARCASHDAVPRITI